MIHIFVCEDSVDGIFTAVYDAWASGFGHANVKLQIEGECNLELFSDYIPVTTDYEKSEKVARSVRRKISEEAFFMIYRTCFSFDTEKADAIYRFLLWGFRYGSKVVSMLAEPAVHRVFELQRKVNNEHHQFIEFLRFREIENHILLGKIHPKCNVVPLIAEHFADRFSGENWIIYDQGRRFAAFHERNSAYYFMQVEGTIWQSVCEREEETEKYPDLWKIFTQTISIKERENRTCQMTHLPLWLRENMTEFQTVQRLAMSKNLDSN